MDQKEKNGEFQQNVAIALIVPIVAGSIAHIWYGLDKLSTGLLMLILFFVYISLAFLARVAKTSE